MNLKLSIIFLLVFISILPSVGLAKIENSDQLGRGVDGCQLNNKYVFDNRQFKKSKIEKSLIAYEIAHNQKQVSQVRLRIEKCNRAVDGLVGALKTDITELVNIKTDILKNKNLKEIETQIKSNKALRKKVQQSASAKMDQLSFKGIFLAAVKYRSVYEKKSLLEQFALQLIQKKAVENINSHFLKIISSSHDGELIRQHLAKLLSNHMKVEKIYLSEASPRNKIYILMAKVSVTPLNQDDPIQPPEFDFFHQNIVLHMTEDPDAKYLTSYGLTEEQVAKISHDVNAFLSSVVQENESVRLEQEQKVKKITQQLVDKSETISKLNQLLVNKKTILTKSYIKLGIKKCNGKLAACAKPALMILDKKITQKKQAIMAAHELRLLVAEKKVSIQDNPAAEISSNVVNLINGLVAEHSVIKKKREKKELENSFVTNYELKSGVVGIRKLNQYWLYIVPQNDDAFKVMTVVRLKDYSLSADAYRHLSSRFSLTGVSKNTGADMNVKPLLSKMTIVEAGDDMGWNEISCLPDEKNEKNKKQGRKKLKTSYQFQILSDPDDAFVKIMNIKPSYFHGIRLYPGRYNVKVSKPGYKTWHNWIQLNKGDKMVKISLMPDSWVEKRSDEN